jgi:hypothetical protein
MAADRVREVYRQALRIGNLEQQLAVWCTVEINRRTLGRLNSSMSAERAGSACTISY